MAKLPSPRRARRDPDQMFWGCLGPGQQLCPGRPEALSRAAALCRATRSWDVAALLPSLRYPKMFSPLSSLILPRLTAPALGLGQMGVVSGTCRVWDIPLRTRRGSHCCPEAKASFPSPGQWARSRCGQSGSKTSVAEGRALAAALLGPSLAPGHGLHPRTAARGWIPAGGRRSKAGGEAGASSGSHMCRGC